MATAPLAYKAPPVPTPVYSWTGFYLNAGGGYGLWNADTTLPPPSAFVISTNTEGGRGWFGTVGGGFDYQLNDLFVIGVLADFNFSNIAGTFSNPSESVSGTMTENNFWAAGGRLGWLVTPQLLAYAEGGFTQARFSGVNFAGMTVGVLPAPGVPFSSIAPNTYDGWFVGAGMETTLPVLGPGWFLRSEYRFYDYNTASLPDVMLPAFGGTVVDIQVIHPYVQTISGSVVYKFNSGGPAPSAASLDSFVADAFKPVAGPSPWTGFSIGAGGGYGMWNVDTSSVVPGTIFATGTGTEGGRGGLGTISAGYDYQLAKRIVGGVFADVDLANIKGIWQDEAAFVSGTLNESTAWAVGARIGWLVTPQILSYFDGGFTQARFDGVNVVFDVAPSIGHPFATLAAQTYDGWFLGGGVETQLPFLGGGWFARAEYRYAQYDSANIRELLVTVPTFANDIVTMRPYVQTVRAEVVYRFNWYSPPIVAK